MSTRARISNIFLPPASREPLAPERIAALASMRSLWVGLALALDISLYVLLRHAPGLRPEIVRRFAECNISLMAIDLGLTLWLLRRPRPGFRPGVRAGVLSATRA